MEGVLLIHVRFVHIHRHAVETNLGRKISESEAVTRRYTEKLFFQVAEGKKKRSVRSSGLEG